MQLSLNALGALSFDLRDFPKTHQVGRDLLRIAERSGNTDNELSARHMMAVSSLARRNPQSEKEFGAAIRTARAKKADHWLIRCLVDSSRSVTARGLGQPQISPLRRSATIESKRGNHLIAGRLWRTVARICAASKSDQVASNAYTAAANVLARLCDCIPETLDVYREWFTWAWDAQWYSEALRVLLGSEKLARKSGDERSTIAAMDQRGVCLQELGKYAEGEALHRTAAAAAHRMGDVEQQERSLNNLGEALRHLDRDDEAISVFHKAERIAARRDVMSPRSPPRIIALWPWRRLVGCRSRSRSYPVPRQRCSASFFL